LSGFFVGLIIQVITFGSFVFLPQRWVRNLRTLILVSSQVVYFAIWVGFVFSITRRGDLNFGKKFDLENDTIHQTKRVVFARSVSFLMGFMLGSFLEMIVVGSLLGVPLNAMPLFITTFF
jgi:hypothetical protein